MHYVRAAGVHAAHQRWAYPVGFAGAFIDTLFGGGGGTLVVIYLHMRGIGRAPFRATVAVLWLVEMVARIWATARPGYYTTEHAAAVRAVDADDGAGTWVGERLGNRISQESFSKLMAVLLLMRVGVLLVR